MMSISKFARKIGVSPTTVSHALSGRGRISDATRKMVLTKVQELGYTPNINAQRLAAGRTHLVVLDCGETLYPLTDMFFVESLQGIQEALRTHGYGLLLNAPGDSLLRWVKALAVDGVILRGFPRDENMAREIARLGMPCVVVSNEPIEAIPGVGSVIIDLRCGMRQVAQMLVGYGHRRIGFLSSLLPNPALPLLREALAALGVDLPEEHVVAAGLTAEGGAAVACALLARPDSPTAIFTRTDTLAFGVLQAAHQMGIRVPDQLSVVGHDDVPFARLTTPPLTTVRVDCIAEGKAAADTLLSLIKQPGHSAPVQVVNTELIVRKTVAAAPVPR